MPCTVVDPKQGLVNHFADTWKYNAFKFQELTLIKSATSLNIYDMQRFQMKNTYTNQNQENRTNSNERATAWLLQ